MTPVIAYLEKNRSRFLEELTEYLRFPSVSAQPQHRKDLLQCVQWIERHCAGLGLQTELCETPGNPILLARTPRRPGRKHFVVYGHYDVQPPDPLDLWSSPPFEPKIVGPSLFARGSSDNKGQHFAHLKAIEAYFKTGTDLPCDLTFLIEGEEEVGSEHLATFLKSHQDNLACDGIVISDSGMPSLRHPALTYSLRGIAALEVKLFGPSRDLHSGLFGGSVENPAMALCQLLAQVRDKRGRIRIPGFYDDVAPLSAYERKQLARLPFSEREYKKFLGVKELFGEKGYTPIEQRSARPTFEINGLTSGYQGAGSKTIVPSWASAKITMRLVPNQSPADILKKAADYLKSICPPTVRLEASRGHSGEPYLMAPQSPEAEASLRALKTAYGASPVLLREGGSIPIVNDFKKILGVDTLLLGMALPDDNAHSPNEKFDIESFHRGTLLGAHLWQELAAARA